jgi:hypothetical protein
MFRRDVEYNYCIISFLHEMLCSHDCCFTFVFSDPHPYSTLSHASLITATPRTLNCSTTCALTRPRTTWTVARRTPPCC